MYRLTFILAATMALATPVAAQSLSVLLPSITFPEPVTTPSTKGCGTTVLTACELPE